jgi:PAS domain S-box-containing protein
MIAMERRLRVLVVEDTADDAELMILALRQGGLDPTWERVETADALKAALATGPWDAVLSDYTLPSFGATAALEVVRAADLDLPFLVVSGTVGEEVAVGTMRAGANDYVLKHNLTRLAPAVAREVREAENRRARRAGEQATAHLAALVESAEDAIISKDLNGDVTSWNPAAERLYGWTAAEAIGRHVSFIVPRDKAEELAGIMVRLRSGQKVEHFETVRVHRDGTRIDVSLTLSPVRDRAGRLVGASKTTRDIRERKRAEEALTCSETRYRRLFEAAQDGVLIVDAESRRIVDVNPFLTELLGYHREELIDKELWEIGLFQDIESNKEAFRKLQGCGYIRYDDHPLRTKDGRHIEVEFVSNTYNVGSTVVIQCNIRDINERRKAEAALRLRDRAIQAVTPGILITDPCQPDNPIIYASPGFQRLTGYSTAEVIGRNCRFLQGKDTDPAAIGRIRDATRECRACTVELLNYSKDGTPFWNNLSISPVLDSGGTVTHFVGVQTDVTERRQLEDQFRQAQKMEAFGQLAGGVAHDFNNLLTVITGYSEIVLKSLSPTDKVRGFIEEIMKAGERSASLTAQLLAFSRKQVIALKLLDLNSIVRDTEKMLRRIIGEDIELVMSLSLDVGALRADAGQLEQVLLNLAVNARDAMPQGGKLSIATENVELDDAYSKLHINARPGSYILLTTSDTGCGMTAETQARIFEPFFTTKGVGKGTGLGLATVYGIVKQAEGHIEVCSDLNVGTSFKIYLPRVNRALKPGTPSDRLDPIRRGTESILLVEDEAGLRCLLHQVLIDCGYSVSTAANASAAIRLARENRDPFDLVVTDVVMPGIGGRQMVEQLITFCPKVKVLYISGYTDDAIVRHGILHDQVPFLQKPFLPSALARKVRDVFDS